MRAEILFPEVCNLYGDLQNIYYLKRCCPELEIVETDLKSRPAFLDGDVTLVFMGSTTEQGLQLAADALRPYRDAIAERIDADSCFWPPATHWTFWATPSTATPRPGSRGWACCPPAPSTT